MKRIIITGGLGYIGSHTVVEAIAAGNHVTIIDNLSNTDLSVLQQLEDICKLKIDFINADCRNIDFVETELRKIANEFDAIIHFAAMKSISESLEMPLAYYDNNLNSLLCILSIIEKFNISHFIFSSSCTVYGQPEVLPVDENALIGEMTNPYAKTKYMAEEIIKDVANCNTKCKFIILRYFNPVGAHISGLIGENPKGKPSNLMPLITQTAIGLYPSLSIFGIDYNTDDGTCIRDFIHVSDLADAHLAALNVKKDERNTEIFNVGIGKGYSVNEMINTFMEETGVQLKIKIEERRVGDIEKIWANNQKIKSTLNWAPKYGLKEIVNTAWRWELNLRNKKQNVN
jgi:UDP-glucose 4-epimerase